MLKEFGYLGYYNKADRCLPLVLKLYNDQYLGLSQIELWVCQKGADLGVPICLRY